MPSEAETFFRLLIPAIGVALLLWLSFRRATPQPRTVEDGPADEPYRVYTREFDLVLPADEALNRIEAVSPDAAKGWLLRQVPPGMRAWLGADGKRAAEPEQLGALFDTAAARLRGAGAGLNPGGTVFCLLVDQSGSMKGQPIARAATAVTLATKLLTSLNVRSEVLGFSTAGWQGGHAYEKWLREGRPPRPGRLCALRHVIYKSADELELGEAARRAMMHPDLLRENIDGEALLWARGRLAARPERHKFLLVISDGAPVDDATLAYNGPSYLYRHLEAVIAELKQEDWLVLGGLGIGHDVESLYPIAARISSPSDLPSATCGLMERMMLSTSPRALDAATTH